MNGLKSNMKMATEGQSPLYEPSHEKTGYLPRKL